MNTKQAVHETTTPAFGGMQLLLYAALSALLHYAGAAILLLVGQPG